MARRTKRTKRTEMEWLQFKAFKFVGLDVREVKGLTEAQLQALMDRSQNGEGEEVRRQLIEMGAIVKAELGMMHSGQGIMFRRKLDLDVRPIAQHIAWSEARQFLTRAIDQGEMEAVRQELISVGAIDTR